MCESKFRMPGGGGGGGGGGVRRGTAFPCASAATLPKTRAFACGAGNGAAATTAAHLPLLSYLPAYSSCPPCPPLSILCLSLSVPSCLACCLPSHCPAVLLPHLRGVPSAHCVADKRRAGASNCAGQQVPALRAHRNTRSVLQQVGNCVAHPQEHTRSGLAAGQCCNELNHGCVVYTCMYVCLYVYVYLHVCVCLLCVCVWGGGLPRTPGRRC